MGTDKKVTVFCRVRPTLAHERDAKVVVQAASESNQVIVREPFATDRQYDFHQIFSKSSTNDDVFRRVGHPSLFAALYKRQSSAVILYGQTNTGKTFTWDALLRKTIAAVFKDPLSPKIRITASFLQLYGDSLTDLLSQSNQQPLGIREDVQSGKFVVPGMSVHSITSPKEALDLVDTGLQARTVALTRMNGESSRSHAVFTLHFSTGGKLALVDLAGSERLHRSRAQGLRMAEAQSINRSLSCIGNVVHALADPKAQHVPFRDSKLTRLLQEPLSADNGRTYVVLTVGPTEMDVQETLSVLQFGQRAMRIPDRAAVTRASARSPGPGNRSASARMRSSDDENSARGDATLHNRVETLEGKLECASLTNGVQSCEIQRLESVVNDLKLEGENMRQAWLSEREDRVSAVAVLMQACAALGLSDVDDSCKSSCVQLAERIRTTAEKVVRKNQRLEEAAAREQDVHQTTVNEAKMSLTTTNTLVDQLRGDIARLEAENKELKAAETDAADDTEMERQKILFELTEVREERDTLVGELKKLRAQLEGKAEINAKLLEEVSALHGQLDELKAESRRNDSDARKSEQRGSRASGDETPSDRRQSRQTTVSFVQHDYNKENRGTAGKNIWDVHSLEAPPSPVTSTLPSSTTSSRRSSSSSILLDEGSANYRSASSGVATHYSDPNAALHKLRNYKANVASNGASQGAAAGGGGFSMSYSASSNTTTSTSELMERLRRGQEKLQQLAYQ